MRLTVATIVVSPFEQNCRLVVDEDSGEGVVVDPGDEAPRILEAVRASGARVKALLATHGHLDHVGAVAPVKDALRVPFAVHRADLPIVRMMPEHGLVFGMRGLRVPTMDVDLAEVSEIPLGSGVIRVVHTPGHTPGGVTFLFDERGRTGLFGDSLFRLSIGRTDLGGDPAVYARTLRDVILAMPDDTVAHCGHGPSTTIGAERVENPFLNGEIQVCPDLPL